MEQPFSVLLLKEFPRMNIGELLRFVALLPVLRIHLVR